MSRGLFGSIFALSKFIPPLALGNSEVRRLLDGDLDGIFLADKDSPGSGNQPAAKTPV
jgi:hypothetical protein